MDFIKEWTLCVAVAAVAGGIVLILSPKGSVEKAVKTAVSLVILCIMLTPFTSGLKLELPKNIDIPSQTDIADNSEELFREMIYEKISKIAEQNSIKNPQIDIDITINENNEMIINSVTITADGGDLENTKKQVSRELGIEVK